MNANGLANTADPLLLLTITDGSSSMNKEILFEKQRMSRAQALARVHNSFWSEASQSCHDNGRARSVYFFSSLRYGNGQVCPGFEGALKDREFVSVGDLIANPLELERITPELKELGRAHV